MSIDLCINYSVENIVLTSTIRLLGDIPMNKTHLLPVEGQHGNPTERAGREGDEGLHGNVRQQANDFFQADRVAKNPAHQEISLS